MCIYMSMYVYIHIYNNNNNDDVVSSKLVRIIYIYYKFFSITAKR